MAEIDVKHPQYLYYLPQFLEVTDETKLLAKRAHDGDNTPDSLHAQFLVSLADPYPSVVITDFYDGMDEELQLAREISPKFKHMSPMSLAYLLKSYRAVKYFGLDFCGGIVRLSNLIESKRSVQQRLLNLPLMVMDEKKASKYIILGVKLESPNLMHRSPNSLEDAVQDYDIIIKLLGTSNENINEIDSLLRLAAGDYKWTLERRKFRLLVKQKYRDMVIDMALEQKGNNGRDKKRKTVLSKE